MSANSKIEWCDHTFNPWIGCTKVSPGCDSCYAAVSTPARTMKIAWGPGMPRHRTSTTTWDQPMLWNHQAEVFKAKHGRRQRVFCASLADVFDNEVDPVWRRELFDLIELTPNLDWLILTKRIGNASEMITRAKSHDWLQGQRHVWIGATIVNQEEANRDINKLLAVQAAKHFVSMEPLLGHVNIVPWLSEFCTVEWRPRPEVRLDWVIAGGESGHAPRPSHPEWYHSLRDQCERAGVPFLFKQWGEWISIGQQGNGVGPGCSDFPGYAKAKHCVLQLNGEVREDWPDGATLMRRVGKAAAGRMLDGVTHDGYPA